MFMGFIWFIKQITIFSLNNLIHLLILMAIVFTVTY
jgi:hypothetical protein